MEGQQGPWWGEEGKGGGEWAWMNRSNASMGHDEVHLAGRRVLTPAVQHCHVVHGHHVSCLHVEVSVSE